MSYRGMTGCDPSRAMCGSGKDLLGGGDRGNGGLMMHLCGNALRRACAESGTRCEPCIGLNKASRVTARERHGQGQYAQCRHSGTGRVPQLPKMQHRLSPFE